MHIKVYVDPEKLQKTLKWAKMIKTILGILFPVYPLALVNCSTSCETGKSTNPFTQFNP